MKNEIIKLLGEGRQMEIMKYTDEERLKKEAIPFIGSPRQHKNDLERIYLDINPLSSNHGLIEFQLNDIVFIEDVEMVSQTNGLATSLLRIWIKKGSVALRIEPFVVSEILTSHWQAHI